MQNQGQSESSASARAPQIDLRSDTVTRPCEQMRRAMAAAEVGDDVYGEDPTVRRLEQRVAELLGKEAGLFVTSGTQGNLVALLSLVGRGDEILIGETGHSFLYEVGGASAFAGVQTHALPVEEDGTLDLERVAAAVHPPGDLHYASTRLLVIENTKDGRALPIEYLDRVREWGESTGLSVHLDGARLFNAAVACEVEPARLAACADTVTVCLSKGLGAPVGSVLCGSEDFVTRARRWRKALGGGLRQVGVLAAAGLVAVERRGELARDHRMAAELADSLAQIPGADVYRCATNMVYVSWPASGPEIPVARLLEEGIHWPGGQVTSGRRHYRLVTHRDLPENAVEEVTSALEQCLPKGP